MNVRLDLDLDLDCNGRYINVYSRLALDPIRAKFRPLRRELSSYKTYMVHYVIEAIIVGLATLVLGLTLSIGFMYTQPEFNIGEITFWPSLIASNFLIGFLIHLLCEWSEINKWYCRNGYACKVARST